MRKIKLKKLKIRLLEKEMEQQELAKRIGVTSQAISDYIRGVYSPSHEKMKRIADELDSTVDELFF